MKWKEQEQKLTRGKKTLCVIGLYMYETYIANHVSLMLQKCVCSTPGKTLYQ